MILAEFEKQTGIKKNPEAFKYLDAVKLFWTAVGYLCPFTNRLL